MRILLRDLRDAFGGARARPGFALAIVLTLGIGTGAAAAVFAVVDAVLIRPLPYPDADRITGVWFASPNFPGGLDRVRQSVATYIHTRDRTEVFSSFGLAEVRSVTFDDGDRPTRIPGAVATADMFGVLGMTPQIGRAFEPADQLPGAEPVVLLTHDLWKTAFAGDAGVIDRTIRVDGVPRRIIGVLPAHVRFPAEDTRLWIPLTTDESNPEVLNFIFTGYGRLRPGVSIERATHDFNRLVNLLPDEYPTGFPRALVDRLQLSPRFVPLRDENVSSARQTLIIVSLAVGVLLLIVLANCAGLFLVRNDARHREMATRIALGAGPGRIARSLVTEGVAYGVIGGAVGILVAAGGIAALRVIGEGTIPRLGEVGIDARTFAMVTAISILVGAAVTLVPLLRLRRMDAATLLRGGSRAVGASRATLRLRGALVIGEVALALTLLVQAGLLVRSLAALQAVQPGFSRDLIGGRLFLPESDYPDYPAVAAFYRNLVDAAREVPGAENAAAVSFLPLRDGRIFFPYQIEGEQATVDLPAPHLSKAVTDGYFETMGIPILDGRSLERSDLLANTDVLVVNRAFVSQHFPGQSAIGKRIRYSPGPDGSGAWLAIVGVVGDVRDRDIEAEPLPLVYLPLQERHATHSRWREMSIVVRGRNPSAFAAPLRSLVAARDRALPLDDVRTMNETLRDATARPRYTMLLLVAAAAAALFLAAVGLYGLLAQLVNDRRREMGLRLALGAQPAQVRRLVMRQALALTATGIVTGATLSLLTGRVAGSVLFQVGTADPLTFAAVTLLIGLVGTLAAHVPASRACAVAPASSLRQE